MRYIKVLPDFLAASNDIKGGSRDPVAESGHPTAIGVSLLLDFDDKVLQFYEIASARKGHGQQMVAAALDGLPRDWEVCVVMDWSDGFWERMKAQYPTVNWNFM